MSKLTKAVALCGGLLVPGLLLCATAAAESAVLDSATQARIRAATFEVVMRKPAQDSLVYERALPLELLPYSERTDQYVSMGTAFAIGDGRFVTAAHVLQPGFRSQYGQPALRGADGVLHEIARIHKWASHQDLLGTAVNPSLEASGAPSMARTIPSRAAGSAAFRRRAARAGAPRRRRPARRMQS